MIRKARHTLYLAGVAAIARGPSFLIPLVIAAIFGANAETDAYFLAYSAVLLVGGTIAQGLEQAVVPFAAAELNRMGGQARSYLDRAALTSAGAALLLWGVALPLLIAASPHVIRASTIIYALAFTVQAVAWCSTSVYTGALIARHQIARSTGSMLWRGAGAALGFALVAGGAPLWVVALSLGAGELARMWWARSMALRDAKPESGGPVTPAGLTRAATAQVIASAAIGAAPMVERLFAARLGPGSVSHVEYALRLLVIPSLVFEGALVPLTLAHWSRDVRDGNAPSAKTVLTTVGRSAGLAIAVGALLAIGAKWFVGILLGHGRFSGDDVSIVAGLLRLLAIAYVGNMCAQMLERYFIATMQNRILAILSIARAGLRVGTMWVWLPKLGLSAFPVGFAVSDWAYCAALILIVGLSRSGMRISAEART